MATIPFDPYEPHQQRDGTWKPVRSRQGGGFERIEWPFSTHGACVVVCAILNEELKRQMDAINAKHIAGWLDEHFPLEDKFGWSGVSMQYMGQRLLLGRRDA